MSIQHWQIIDVGGGYSKIVARHSGKVTLDPNSIVLSGPTTLVEYSGTSFATVVGLAAGPDGIYFSDLYKDNGTSPIERGANIWRVRKH